MKCMCQVEPNLKVYRVDLINSCLNISFKLCTEDLNSKFHEHILIFLCSYGYVRANDKKSTQKNSKFYDTFLCLKQDK